MTSNALHGPANDFDSVAWAYDWLAELVFLGAIRRAQLALLPQLSVGCGKALVIGGGTGWFLVELLEQTSVPRVVYLEKSKNMLARSRALVSRAVPQHADRVEFRLGTEASLADGDGTFDLVVTNFFLDLFADAHCQSVARRLGQHLGPRGRWLFVDFHMPAPGPARLLARGLFQVMFTFFNVVSNMESRRPPDYAQALLPLGLRRTHRKRFYLGIIEARLLERS